jgi:hypothetical protein
MAWINTVQTVDVPFMVSLVPWVNRGGVDGWFLLKQVVLKNVRSKLLKFTLGIW